jgi:hypothetical protein
MAMFAEDAAAPPACGPAERDAGGGGAVAPEEAAGRLARRIKSDPAYAEALYAILAHCGNPCPDAELVETIAALPVMRTAWQSPQALLSWLAEAGGLEKLERPEEKADPRPPVETSLLWSTTPIGRQVLADRERDDRLGRLLACEENHRDAYLRVLWFCLSPRSRTEIEAMLKGHPALAPGVLYASFFMDTLEKAGGLAWEGGWLTTPPGKNLLEKEE